MGKNHPKIKKITISTKLDENIQCPICLQEFNTNVTYKELNQHLFRCGNVTNRNKLNYRTSSANNDFQLVIDYNPIINKKEVKTENSPLDLETKYDDFYRYIEFKKSQMKQEANIKVKNKNDIINYLNDINIYNDVIFILTEDNNNKITLINYIPYYFEYMINNNLFTIINGKSIFFSFESNINFKNLGIVFASILINPSINLKYKFSQLLCKVTVGERINLFDLQYTNNELYEELIKMNHNENIEDMNLTYEIDGNELIVEGGKVKVTMNNIEDYIEKRVNYEIQKFKYKILELRNGIHEFIPEKEINLFSGDELYQIINKMI